MKENAGAGKTSVTTTNELFSFNKLHKEEIVSIKYNIQEANKQLKIILSEKNKLIMQEQKEKKDTIKTPERALTSEKIEMPTSETPKSNEYNLYCEPKQKNELDLSNLSIVELPEESKRYSLITGMVASSLTVLLISGTIWCAIGCASYLTNRNMYHPIRKNRILAQLKLASVKKNTALLALGKATLFLLKWINFFPK